MLMKNGKYGYGRAAFRATFQSQADKGRVVHAYVQSWAPELQADARGPKRVAKLFQGTMMIPRMPCLRRLCTRLMPRRCAVCEVPVVLERVRGA